MQHQNFAGKLHKLTRLLTSLSEHRWASNGYGDIRVAHLQVLIQLEEKDFTNNQLAIIAGMTKQSMNRLTNELLTSGYIIHADKQSADGRLKILTLSEKGKTFVSYLETTRYDLENKLAEVIEVSRFKALNQTLEDLLIYVEQRHRSL